MKKELTRIESKIYHYKDGKKVYGAPAGVWGNLSGVSGDLSGVSGDLSSVWGDLSGVSGDLSSVWGNLSGVSGDLDECEITEKDRAKGIDINDLIK